MLEYAEEEEAIKFADTMRALQILGICLEFKKLPHEVKQEDRWTIELLSTALKAIKNKTEMEIKKREFLARNQNRG